MAKPAMRLAVVLPSLAGGGMERAHLHLIKEWRERGIAVDLVVSRRKGELCDEIPDDVRVFEVAPHYPAFFPIGFSRYLKRHQPTHILTAANDVSALTLMVLGWRRTPIPTVISMHNHLSSQLELAKGLERLKMHLAARVLNRIIHNSRGVIAVSRGVAEDLKRHFPLYDSRRLHVVYNPVITRETDARAAVALDTCPVPRGTPWILYAGRFVHQKGLDVLVDAFENLSKNSDAHLVLIGDGPLKTNITAQVMDRGLQGRVHMPGFQANPLPWVREADVLVLPSRTEGLGNILIEALNCGTQVVATDCPGGPAEVLDNGRYGQLVPVENAEALSEALLRSLNNRFHIEPEILKERAELFTAARAASLYEAILTTSR